MEVTEIPNRPQAGTCEQCGKDFKSRPLHWAKSDSCNHPDRIQGPSKFAFFSGGLDSVVATHFCMSNGLTEAVVHMDTGTGLKENLDYVIDVCERYNWDLYITKPKKSLKEFALKYGFPSAGAHSWIYRYLKEHPAQQLAGLVQCEDKPEFYTGVYKAESTQRMENISGYEQEREAWIWKAPLMEWEKEDFIDYREKHDLPENEVVKNIHRSGECFCGAYATRDMELIDLQANYPKHAEWILEVEKEVQEEIGTEEDFCWWGHNGLNSKELQDLIGETQESAPPMLCKGCAKAGNVDFDEVRSKREAEKEKYSVRPSIEGTKAEDIQIIINALGIENDYGDKFSKDLLQAIAKKVTKIDDL